MPGNFTDYYICQELITCSLKRMIFVCLIYYSYKKKEQKDTGKEIFFQMELFLRSCSVGYNGIEQEDWRQS